MRTPASAAALGTALLALSLLMMVSEPAHGRGRPRQPTRQATRRAAVVDTPNASGVLRTISLDGSDIDRTNPFFLSLGTNGRSCVSCHVPSTAWTISPSEVND